MFKKNEIYLMSKTGHKIQIIKNYGPTTPTKDYNMPFKINLSNWYNIKNITTGDIFPITGNKLKRAKLKKIKN